MSYKERLESQLGVKIIGIEEVEDDFENEDPEERLVNLIVELSDGNIKKIRRPKRILENEEDKSA